jgi:hypothetical protein
MSRRAAPAVAEGEEQVSEKEQLAVWMIKHSFATGHGGTLEDLLKELSWQVDELRDATLGAAAQTLLDWCRIKLMNNQFSCSHCEAGAEAIRLLRTHASNEGSLHLASSIFTCRCEGCKAERGAKP